MILKIFRILMLISASVITASEGVYVDPGTGETSLACNPEILTKHSDVSKWDVITDMVVFQGELYCSAAHDYRAMFSYSNGAQVFRYNMKTDTFQTVYDRPGSILMNLRVADDKLMAPEFFPFGDSPRTIHTYDGRGWGKLALLPPVGWHALDVAEYKGELYVSCSWRSPGGQKAGDAPDAWKGFGRCYRSPDRGKTWNMIRQTSEIGRIQDMAVLNGYLYANERGKQLIRWDGSSWAEIPVKLKGVPPGKAALGNGQLFGFRGKLFALTPNLYYTFDGKTWGSYTPGFLDLFAFENVLYGLRGDGCIYRSSDGITWRKLSKTGIPPEDFNRKPPNGGRPIHRGSVAVFRGRLFAGSGSRGEVFSSPYLRKGEFTSGVLPSTGGEITFKVSVPENTDISFHIRSAVSKTELKKAFWREETRIPEKHRWYQYRAIFTSDGEKTPVLISTQLTPLHPDGDD